MGECSEEKIFSPFCFPFEAVDGGIGAFNFADRMFVFLGEEEEEATSWLSCSVLLTGVRDKRSKMNKLLKTQEFDSYEIEEPSDEERAESR